MMARSWKRENTW